MVDKTRQLPTFLIFHFRPCGSRSKLSRTLAKRYKYPLYLNIQNTFSNVRGNERHALSNTITFVFADIVTLLTFPAKFLRMAMAALTCAYISHNPTFLLLPVEEARRQFQKSIYSNFFLVI